MTSKQIVINALQKLARKEAAAKRRGRFKVRTPTPMQWAFIYAISPEMRG